MLPSKVLRMKDLTRVGINNWPTLKRRVAEDDFPPGRYVGANTRVWTSEEVEAWWDSRPKAGRPPDIVGEPVAGSPGRETGNRRAKKDPIFTPGYSETNESVQAFPRSGERS
jgi:predicted DNA-binding transcriptional regulator AlpA